MWKDAQIKILEDMVSYPLHYQQQVYARSANVDYGHDLVSVLALYPGITEDDACHGSFYDGQAGGSAEPPACLSWPSREGAYPRPGPEDRRTSMLRYSATRLLLAIPILLAVFTLVFLVVRVIPGDPAQAALGDYASKEAVDALRERMGLNDPLHVQYFRYLGQSGCGETWAIRSSPALRSARTVAHVLPYTLELTFASVLVGVVAGHSLGVLTASEAQ